MKKYVKETVTRGLLAAWAGPVILAVIYGITGNALSAAEVCRGILSMTLMAFVAGGVTVVYTIERLPLPPAVLTHGVVLYLDYLMMYRVNRWLPWNPSALGIFTAVFVVGYAVIWLLIYLSIRRNTDSINQKLRRDKA